MSLQFFGFTFFSLVNEEERRRFNKHSQAFTEWTLSETSRFSHATADKIEFFDRCMTINYSTARYL